MLINGIDLNQEGLCVKLSKVKLCSRQFKQDHSTYKKQVQNVQTNVPAPVKSYHGTCVLNYYASGSTCKLTEEMTFYVGFFCLFVPPPLLSSICQSGLMENDL